MQCFLLDHLFCPQSPLTAFLENFLECTASLFFKSIKAILRVSPTLLPFILGYYKCITFWTHFTTYFRAKRTLEMVFLHVEEKRVR